MRLVFDMEANGLLDTVDKLWCICTEDIDTGLKRKFDPEQLDKALEYMSQADVLIGHNIIGYDFIALERIKGWKPNENTRIYDTYLMSRLAFPDRAKPFGYTGKGGSHSLEAWGYRVGTSKPGHEEWSVYSPAMLRRCQSDVAINVLTYHVLSSELEIVPDEVLVLETKIFEIITEQEQYGICFDYDKAVEYQEWLTAKIEEIDREIVPLLPKELEVIGASISNPFIKTGGYRKAVLRYADEAYGGHCEGLIGGPFTKIQIHDFNLGSVGKVKDFLMTNGWLPDFWNISKKTGEITSPKLEGDFLGITGNIPTKVKERLTWRHRRSQIEGWINRTLVDNDGHNVLQAGANTVGTPTFRFTHRLVVNVPKANADKDTHELIWDPSKQKDIFGTQMRGLFIPRPGYVIVGHDASGIELRMLAHYLNDSEFTKQILEGDIHTFNQEKAGLPTRDAAKTFIYALIYGAGDAKIGAIIGGTAEDGKAIKERYFESFPTLKKFIDKVKRAAGKGYLKGLDGRRIVMRRDSAGRIARAKALNTLLQSAGAIVMKRSCVILWDDVNDAQIDAKKVLDMHDEGQSEVINNPSQIELYKKLAVLSIRKAGEYYNMNIALDAEAKEGMSWASTH